MIATTHLPRIKSILKHKYTLLYGMPSFLLILFIALFFFTKSQSQAEQLSSLSDEKAKSQRDLTKKNASLSAELTRIQNIDQYKKNEILQKEIQNIQTTYKGTVGVYEKLQDMKAQKKDVSKYEKELALSLKQLSETNYASGTATLASLSKQIADDEAAASAALASLPANTNVTASNTAPGSGYSLQKVHSDVGDFIISLVAADLNSTRVIVDTATDGDCRDNCAVLSLGEYVSRNGAFAGINGSYFCPASYPSCAGKTNSFDLLVMNKNKKYLNSDNNVYSTNPAVIFQNNSARFVSRALEWGRDTGVDAVISNYPLLLSGGNITFGGDNDPKKGSKGPRSFIGNKGSTVYIGVISNATVAEGAHVLKALGLENAMNLDSGGSTALWSGGYKAGPGRAIPNAILFVRK